MDLKCIWIFFLVIIQLIGVLLSARILAWMPTPSYSHQIIMKTIVQELIQRNHQVTYLTPTLMNFTENSHKSNLRIVDLSKDYKLRQRFKLFKPKVGLGQFALILEFASFTGDVVSYQFGNPEVQELLKSEKFDLVIVEGALYPSLMALGNHFGCPKISISSLPTPLTGTFMMGDSLNPSYETDFFLPFSKPTNFLERLVSALHYWWYYYAINWVQFPIHDKIVEKYLGNQPKVNEIPVDLLLTNEHPVLSGGHVPSGDIIQIGGILQGIQGESLQSAELDEELERVLNNSKEGVIYFSLGSNVKSSLLSEKTLNKFIEAFSQLKQKVFWKFETESTPKNASGNIIFRKWFPQTKILRHPNLKLMIFQGGLQSFEEAIHARVPLIGIPFFADQLWNVDRIKKLGIGERMNFLELTGQKFLETINLVLNNKSYQDRINEVADILEDQPLRPLDKAVYWIEFLLRHKKTDLFKNPAYGVPLYQYYLVDVIFTIAIAFLVFVYLVIKLVKLLVLVIKFIMKKIVNKKDSKIVEKKRK